MAQQYPEWNENNVNHENNHDEISPRPLQYRDSSLNPYGSMASVMSASMQSLHSEVSQQYQEMSNPGRAYSNPQSHSQPQQPPQAHYPHLTSSDHPPPSSPVSNQPTPYANSWHYGRSDYQDTQDSLRAARRATSFNHEDGTGYAVTTPSGYSGRHSRRSSTARSTGPGADRASSEQGDAYMPNTGSHGHAPLSRTSNASLQYAYHNPDDVSTPHYPASSIDTTAVSRRSHQSYRNGPASIRSPTITNGETMAYDTDGQPGGRAIPGHVYPYQTATETTIVKEGTTDERSIATSGDGDDMIVRQDLRRQLHERHVGMIALTGAIGIGLFLTSGRVLKIAGPGGAVLAYFLMGTVANAVMACLGEMTALISIPGPMSEFASRFVDDSLGFAVGWMFW
ncbi:hypothetical protein AA313_de0201541 [Arthrobotrys entomopaga]|nr:hypothetical protein AA313_de0201541 [Arthrobotrys entomopaga]